jgi:hypothetical protein
MFEDYLILNVHGPLKWDIVRQTYNIQYIWLYYLFLLHCIISTIIATATLISDKTFVNHKGFVT